MTDFYLWLDFESTGLDINDTTVLEFAWTVTDPDLRQLTPLRSRYSALPTGCNGAVVPSTETNRGGGHGWSNGLRVAQVVRDMHKGSRLYYDWLSEPSFRVIDSVRDFDRLILDDLWSAGWVGKGSVFLAGAGVSHYDRPVLDALGALQLDGKPALHYRSADVSAAQQLLPVQAVKNSADLEKLMATANGDPRELLQLDTDSSTTLLSEYRGDDVYTFDLGQAVNHRAAADVAFALVLARCLRALTTRVTF